VTVIFFVAMTVGMSLGATAGSSWHVSGGATYWSLDDVVLHCRFVFDLECLILIPHIFSWRGDFKLLDQRPPRVLSHMWQYARPRKRMNLCR